jgi:hypothetical protein
MLAYMYTKTNGIETTADYPYVSGSTRTAGVCKYNAAKIKFKNTN